MKILLVGGDWDRKGGRESYLVSTIKNKEIEILNGGNFEDLKNIIDADALIWMPNISNDEEKILPTLKKKKPSLLLVQSKRKRNYSDFEIVKRLLASHSSLGITITDDKKFSVIDPLGNLWLENSDINSAVDLVVDRLKKYKGMTRLRSKNSEELLSFKLEESFLNAVTKSANTFDHLIKAINPERFLGNASTRCAHGFPSYRKEKDWCIVSRRNINKSIISDNGFVPVRLKDGIVEYCGDHKPSVDTPIQLKLYSIYRNVNYIVHGHVYAKDAPFTKNHVPCGYLEEVEEILEQQPDVNATNFCINLKGHGCIVLAASPDFINSVEFIERPTFELQD